MGENNSLIGLTVLNFVMKKSESGAITQYIQSSKLNNFKLHQVECTRGKLGGRVNFLSTDISNLFDEILVN